MGEIYDNYEQSERVRNWLKENGGAIVLGIVMALAVVAGGRYWNANIQNKRVEAASEFRSLTLALQAAYLDAAVGNFETLKARYQNSAYVGLAALYMAKARLEGGQFELAENNYRLAMESDGGRSVETIARERLARLLLDRGRADEALALLDGVADITGFESRYAEVRGDILAVNGDIDGARNAYQQALDTMEAGTGDRDLVRLKIDNLDNTPVAVIEHGNGT